MVTARISLNELANWVGLNRGMVSMVLTKLRIGGNSSTEIYSTQAHKCIRNCASTGKDMTSKILTVLFADLTESTRMFQTQGDVEAHQQVSDSLLCMQQAVEQQHGTLLRTVGDSILASFNQSDEALQAAIEIQREHQLLNLSVRVGFHHGNVILDGGDIYGSAVNLAARVAAFCEADEICTTEDTIRQLSIRQRSSSMYLDRVKFKGINEPIPVYRIHWDNDDSHTAIATAPSLTHRYQNNLVLDIQFGKRKIRIDNDNTSVTFGRSSDNDMSMDLESVSRNHAKIEMAKGRFVIQDHSTNGTFIIKSDSTSEFIRRESTTLENFGCIGLGFSPDESAQPGIEFCISTVALS